MVSSTSPAKTLPKSRNVNEIVRESSEMNSSSPTNTSIAPLKTPLRKPPKFTNLERYGRPRVERPQNSTNTNEYSAIAIGVLTSVFTERKYGAITPDER